MADFLALVANSPVPARAGDRKAQLAPRVAEL
jgi:hypothetical protein